MKHQTFITIIILLLNQKNGKDNFKKVICDFDLRILHLVVFFINHKKHFESVMIRKYI